MKRLGCEIKNSTTDPKRSTLQNAVSNVFSEIATYVIHSITV